MVPSLVVAGITCVLMICGILFFPRIGFGKFKVDSYWAIALVGAVVAVLFGLINFKELVGELTKDSSVNPIKILVLFISMTILSVFLDEAGFFRYLASKTLNLAKKSQKSLFVALYVIVSVLTVFTSNDIIVLTFTPFICYFCKNAKISAVPYLVTEFIAANTMSMALIIGNPTNIYIATSYGVNFLEYIKVMILPTVASFLVAFLILYLIFRKELSKPAEVTCEEVKIENKPLLVVGLIHLIVCTVVLAISSYLGIEMWAVSLAAVGSLCVCTGVTYAIEKRKPTELVACVRRAPWQLVPFVLSMFTLILTLSSHGFTEEVGRLLGTENTVVRYGIASFLSANVINNIPMSVLFCPIISTLEGAARTRAVYASIVGSNLGAYLTPIGALAGIMWSSMLKKHEIKFSYLDFIKYGALISVPTLAANLAVLSLII